MHRLLPLLLLLSACAVRHTGFVFGTGDAAEIRTLDGVGYPLVLKGDSEPLGYLDGHTAQVDGMRIFRAVHVRDWRVHDGLHGLPTWVGPVVVHEASLGIQDRNSGVFYFVDPASARGLERHMGKTVLIEGWVEDAQTVTVAYFRVLAPTDEDSEAP